MKMLPGVGLGTTLEVSPDLGPGMSGRTVYCSHLHKYKTILKEKLRDILKILQTNLGPHILLVQGLV